MKYAAIKFYLSVLTWYVVHQLPQLYRPTPQDSILIILAACGPAVGNIIFWQHYFIQTGRYKKHTRLTADSLVIRLFLIVLVTAVYQKPKVEIGPTQSIIGNT
jgi:hypothetical protein